MKKNRISRFALASLAVAIAFSGAMTGEARAEVGSAFAGASFGSLFFQAEGIGPGQSSRSGAYRADGTIAPIGVITGQPSSDAALTFNSFYVADISGLTANVTGAYIGYNRTDNRVGTPTITYGVFQGDAASLWNAPSFSPTIFQGLQASPALASFIVTESGRAVVDLGPGFVAAVNAAITSGAHYFAVGGTTGARGGGGGDGGGVGAPGPVVGAGLPFPLAAGVAWLLSTCKARGRVS